MQNKRFPLTVIFCFCWLIISHCLYAANFDIFVLDKGQSLKSFIKTLQYEYRFFDVTAQELALQVRENNPHVKNWSRIPAKTTVYVTRPTARGNIFYIRAKEEEPVEIKNNDFDRYLFDLGMMRTTYVDQLSNTQDLTYSMTPICLQFTQISVAPGDDWGNQTKARYVPAKSYYSTESKSDHTINHQFLLSEDLFYKVLFKSFRPMIGGGFERFSYLSIDKSTLTRTNMNFLVKTTDYTFLKAGMAFIGSDFALPFDLMTNFSRSFYYSHVQGPGYDSTSNTIINFEMMGTVWFTKNLFTSLEYQWGRMSDEFKMKHAGFYLHGGYAF